MTVFADIIYGKTQSGFQFIQKVEFFYHIDSLLLQRPLQKIRNVLKMIVNVFLLRPHSLTISVTVILDRGFLSIHFFNEAESVFLVFNVVTSCFIALPPFLLYNCPTKKSMNIIRHLTIKLYSFVLFLHRCPILTVAICRTNVQNNN